MNYENDGPICTPERDYESEGHEMLERLQSVTQGTFEKAQTVAESAQRELADARRLRDSADAAYRAYVEQFSGTKRAPSTGSGLSR